MTTVAGLQVGIGGDPTGLINALNASTRAVTQFSTNVTQMNARVNSSALSIGRLLAALGVGISFREVVNYADAWKQVEARLGIVTRSTEELRRVQRELFAIAQESRAEFESTATLYTRLAQSQKQLGLSSRDLVKITRTVTQALAIEGRSASEVSSTIRQLAQAFGSGKFAGDELRSVSENASLLFGKMAESLGLTIGEFRKLSSEGKISVEQVARAILESGDAIAAQAGRLPTTVGGALTQLRNSVQRFIGETDAATGATKKLVEMINALGNAFDNHRAAVETFAFVIGAGVLVKAINLAIGALGRLAAGTALAGLLSLIPAIRSLRDAFAFLQLAIAGAWRTLLGPIGIIATAIGIAAAVFFKWRKGVEETRKEAEKLRTGLEKMDPKELTTRIEDSLRDLTRMNAEARRLRANIEAAARGGGVAPGDSDELVTLERRITSVQKALNAMIEVRNAAGADATPIIKPSAEDELKKFADGVSRVIETFRIMQKQGEHVHRVVDRLRVLFDETQRKLRGLKDPFGEEALRLRKILADLLELPEIKLRVRIDTSTREIRQLAEAEVKKLTEALTAKDSGLIPKITVQPIIDTSLASSSMQRLAQRLPAEMAAAIGKVRFDTLRDRLAQQLGSLPIKIEPAGLDIFNRAVDQAVAAQNRLNLARLGGDRHEIISAEQQYAAAIDTVRNALGGLARSLDSTNIKADDQALAIAAINEAAGKLQATLSSTTSRLDKLMNFARAATGIGRAILGLADAMRSVDENIRRTLQSAVNLTDALVDLAQAQKDLRAGTGSAVTVAASALGAAGAGLSIVNSIVTAIQSDNEKLRQVVREQTEIQRENNRNLERLRIEVGGFTGAIGDFRTALTALRGPLDPSRGGTIGAGFTSVQQLIERLADIQRETDGRSFTQNILGGVLREFGTSLAEVSAIADELNVTLFDSAGRIIPEAFGLLADKIELNIRRLTEWSNTLDDTRQRMELEANVFDFEATAQRTIQQGIAQLQTLAPAIFDKFFGSIDPNNAGQVEAALRLLTRTLLDNVASLSGDFDALFGRDELIQIIELVESGLDGLAKAANEVTASLLNVPQGFKLERARFEATLARTVDSIAGTFDSIEIDKIKPGALTLTGRQSLDTVQDQNISAGGDVFIIEQLNVDARERPAAELVDAIKYELKTKARNHGLTARPSSMLDI